MTRRTESPLPCAVIAYSKRPKGPSSRTGGGTSTTLAPAGNLIVRVSSTMLGTPSTRSFVRVDRVAKRRVS